MTKLPPPEQWIISRMNEMECAEMIERYIDYVDKDGRSVHLPMQFVRHYLQRHDGALPTLVAIATLPIVLADGGLLAPDGLDRDRGIMFIIPKELMAIIPRQKDCTDKAVQKAMGFLCDEWLCDVASDYSGKCTLIAAALTVIERSLLPDRPAFFVTAGRRGGGKTTTLTMLIVAITGMPGILRPLRPRLPNKRAEIMQALYTILLGNPMLKTARDAPSKTRFKMWWRLIGSAVEHAANLQAQKSKGAAQLVEIDFQKLFIAQEEDDEESASLADALRAMAEEWPDEKEFRAAEVAQHINNTSFNQCGLILREFLYPGIPSISTASAKSVGNRLKKHRDEPIKCGDRMLVLRSRPKDNELCYHVHVE